MLVFLFKPRGIISNLRKSVPVSRLQLPRSCFGWCFGRPRSARVAAVLQNQQITVPFQYPPMPPQTLRSLPERHELQHRVRRALKTAFVLLVLAVSLSATPPAKLAILRNKSPEPFHAPELRNSRLWNQCPMIPRSYPISETAVCDIEVGVCEPLNLAFLHVYKAGGTALAIQLDEFCFASTGTNIKLYTGYVPRGEGIGRPCDLDGICSNLTCYAVLRDPVDRFLSAYHEAMIRGWDKTLKHYRLPTNSTREQQLEVFRLALDLRERNETRDAHLRLQSYFLPPTAPVNIFYGPRASQQVKDFLCRAHTCFRHPANETKTPSGVSPVDCPVKDTSRSNVTRSRMSNYGDERYVIRESDLTDSEINRIARIFKSDYCRYELAVHARLPANTILCDR